MPHDMPDMPDLLQTVRDFIDELMPRLDAQDRYHALCALYLLDIARRELGEWVHQPTSDDARLAALVEGGAEMPPELVIKTLCENIRDGQHDDRLPQLFEVMQAHVIDKVRVSRPDYLQDEDCANTPGNQ